MELKQISVNLPTTPTATNIPIDSVRHHQSPDHQSSLNSASKKRGRCCDCIRSFFAALCSRQKPEPLAETWVIGQKIFENPSEVLRAMNPAAKTPVSLNINVRNNRGESLIYLFCKEENLSRVFTLEDGTRFIPTIEILRYIITHRNEHIHLDFEVRNLSDQGFLSQTTEEIRMLILNNTYMQDIMKSTSFTFRGALEKAILFSSTDWMDDTSLKEQEATWVSTNIAIRKAYLQAAQNKVEEWPEKHTHRLEYPRRTFPLTAVVKYCYMSEWLDLLNAMLRELDKPRRTSPTEIRSHIAEEIDNLSEWLQAEKSPLTLAQRENYQKAYSALSNCKFYQTQLVRN